MRLNQAGLDPSRSDGTGQDEAELERIGSAPESIWSDMESIGAPVGLWGGPKSHPKWWLLDFAFREV